MLFRSFVSIIYPVFKPQNKSLYFEISSHDIVWPRSLEVTFQPCIVYLSRDSNSMQILLNMAFSLEGLFISLIAAVIATADCYCYSRTLYASTYSQSTSVSPSSVYSYCTIRIRPFSYSTSYYLELKWSSNFDVRGNMPLCKENYIEVFLTR